MPSQHFFPAPNADDATQTHRIAYFEWGAQDNPNVVVCVHGLTRNAHDFDSLAEALATTRRVICIDVAGRGDSDYLANSQHYIYPNYAADCLALLAHLGLTSVQWVGTSMGGIIGMWIAAQVPTLISRMVLNDVGSIISKPALERIFSYVSTTPTFATRAEAESYLRRTFSTFGIKNEAHWNHFYTHGIKATDNSQFCLNFDYRIIDPVRTHTENFTKVEAVDLSAFWNLIKIPTLILRGAESDLLTHENAQAMLATNPQAKLVEFAGIGHAPSLYEEDQIGIVRDFLV